MNPSNDVERETPLEVLAGATSALAGATLLALTGLFVGVLLGVIAFVLLGAFVTVPQGSPLTSAVTLVSTGAGLLAVGALYLSNRGLSTSYLRLRWPTARDVAWAVGATVALFAALVVLSIIVERFGLSAAGHSVAERGQENPALLLPLIPLSVLVTGPAEEFFYRGIVQNRLREAFDDWTSVLLAAIVFSLVHVPAYGLGGIDWSLATSLGILFVLGAVLGSAYELTDNLVVPAVAHGIYNAVVFGRLYANAVGLF